MKKIVNYFKDSYHELTQKVSWPSWDELQNSAIVVSIASLIIAVLVFVMDFTFGIQQISFGQFIWKGILGFLYGA